MDYSKRFQRVGIKTLNVGSEETKSINPAGGFKMISGNENLRSECSTYWFDKNLPWSLRS